VEDAGAVLNFPVYANDGALSESSHLVGATQEIDQTRAEHVEQDASHAIHFGPEVVNVTLTCPWIRDHCADDRFPQGLW
jgi:hypothetical protein